MNDYRQAYLDKTISEQWREFRREIQQLCQQKEEKDRRDLARKILQQSEKPKP